MWFGIFPPPFTGALIAFRENIFGGAARFMRDGIFNGSRNPFTFIFVLSWRSSNEDQLHGRVARATRGP